MSFLEHTSSDLPESVSKQLLTLPAVRTRMEFQFALLSAAGGVVLAAGQETEGIALLAVFCAVFGFVFVDWLRIIELPPIGAYLAMGGAAAYCVYDFWGLQQRGEPQMESVALLLVLVQGVLMMQYKSRRILEQLAVFCLLELVVAAIFNDAINFGLMLIPIAMVGGSALSSLGLVTLMENIDVALDRPAIPVANTRLGRLLQFIAGHGDDDPPQHTLLASSSPESVISIYQAASSWSRYAITTLSPAILLIASTFFFGLPRQVPPSRSKASGPALVGFDDELRMEQLGQVMQNSQLALKVKLTRNETSEPYLVDGSLYLRGKVLETYELDESVQPPVAKWISSDRDSLSHRSKLPELNRRRESAESAQGDQPADDVHVKITCEAMSRPALFAIAPYYQVGDAADVVHATDRWTLSREQTEPPFPRIQYEFGTVAFHQGVQTRLIAQDREIDRPRTPYGLNRRSIYYDRAFRSRRIAEEDLVRIDRSRVPSASRLAVQVIEGIPDTERHPLGIAKAMENYLSTNPQFSYTLNLNATPIANLDPVEQFLSIDRRGHCQYFASSLALMLRSVGIPCRIVVGYRTEEYNNIGKYYIVRQSHAHAWVEALIDPAPETSQSLESPPQRPQRYWVQLEPTPAASSVDDGNPEGVDGLLNLANNLWEDYVVEMDSERQKTDLAKATGLAQASNSYRGVLGTVQKTIAEIRAGKLDRDRLSLPERTLLLPIITACVAVFIVAAVLRRIRLRIDWFRPGRSRRKSAAPPALRFYADTLQQLRRVEIVRHSDETPSELCNRVGPRFPALKILTRAFEHRRYGQSPETELPEQVKVAFAELTRSIDDDLRERHR